MEIFDLKIFDWFKFMQNHAGLNIYVYVFTACCLALIVCLYVLVNLQFVHDWFGDGNGKYSSMICEYAYSSNNKICIFEDYCRISRSGAFVSKPISNVIDIKCSSNSDDRILSITYQPGDKIEKEVVHCGKMSAHEFYKVRKMLLDV